MKILEWLKKALRIHSPSAHAKGYDFAWDMYSSIKLRSKWYMIGKRISDGLLAALDGAAELQTGFADAIKEKLGETPTE